MDVLIAQARTRPHTMSKDDGASAAHMSENTESLVLPGERDRILVAFASTDKNSSHYKRSYMAGLTTNNKQERQRFTNNR